MRYLIDVAHGIGAAMVCAAFFYLTGLALTSRRDERWQSASLVVLGSAVFVVLCWIAISAQRVPLTVVTLVFAGAVLMLSIVRNRRIVVDVTAGLASRSLGVWFLLFALFYLVAYVMTWPPVVDPSLVRSGSSDLLTYARYANHLLIFGSPDLYEADFEYLRNPAVPHLLAGFSFMFNHDPLSAAMPAQFALVALTGITTAGVCRSTFSLPPHTALVIATILSTSPYFRQVASAYHLPALITVNVFLFLFWLMARLRENRAIDGPLTVLLTAAYVILLFTDAPSLFAAVGLQAVLIATLAVSQRNVRGIALPSAISALIVGSAFFGRVRWSLQHLDLSTALTSTTLTLGIVLLAAVAHIVSRDDLLRRVARTPLDRRLANAGVVYAAIALVAGNAAVHAAKEPAPLRMSVAWRGVEQLRPLRLDELTLRIDRGPDRLVAALTRYLLPETRVHIFAPNIRLRGLPFETISRHSPMLIQDAPCDSVGHDDVTTIPDIGCVLFAPPALALDEHYPFSQPFLFVTFDGLDDAEPGGRWNTGRGVRLRVMSDPGRTSLAGNLHVNLLVRPVFPTGQTSHRLILNWGAHHSGEIVVGAEEWISLPISATDWTGDRVWHLPISVTLTHNRTIQFRDLLVSEAPRGRAVQ